MNELLIAAVCGVAGYWLAMPVIRSMASATGQMLGYSFIVLYMRGNDRRLTPRPPFRIQHS